MLHVIGPINLNERPDEEGITTFAQSYLISKLYLNERPDEEGITT